MKKLIIVIATLSLFTSTAYCASITKMYQMVVAAKNADGESSPTCSTCTPEDPADLLCEDFEGTDNSGYYCSGWTESIAGGNSFNKNYSTPFSFPETGSEALNVVISSSSSDAYAYKDIDNVYEINKDFYFYLNSESLANGQHVPIFGVLNNGLSYYTAAVFLKQTSGGDLVLEAYCVTGGYFEGTTVLSASTQYHVEVEFDNSGGAGSDILKMWVNDSGTPEVNQTAIDCATDLSSYAIIGGAAAGLDAAANFVIDGIQIDDDTDPE